MRKTLLTFSILSTQYFSITYDKTNNYVTIGKNKDLTIKMSFSFNVCAQRYFSTFTLWYIYTYIYENISTREKWNCRY